MAAQAYKWNGKFYMPILAEKRFGHNSINFTETYLQSYRWHTNHLTAMVEMIHEHSLQGSHLNISGTSAEGKNVVYLLHSWDKENLCAIFYIEGTHKNGTKYRQQCNLFVWDRNIDEPKHLEVCERSYERKLQVLGKTSTDRLQ
uniref:Putative lipocalin n=1 Tax=Rhipicephalus microplus TaxID=6941 RepID=A0A6G5A2I0_RHIMP